MSECPFCHLPEKLTEWYYWDVINQIVVCKDLHDRQYEYRILGVGYGKRWHKPWKDYSQGEKKYILALVTNVAEAHIANGANLVNIDTKHFSIKDHGHVQAGMI